MAKMLPKIAQTKRIRELPFPLLQLVSESLKIDNGGGNVKILKMATVLATIAAVCSAVVQSAMLHSVRRLTWPSVLFSSPCWAGRTNNSFRVWVLF
jgi:hypothetical protein